MLTLELLGTLSLRDETRPVPVAAQQKRPLGLLAILGLGGKPGLLRDRIEAYLWPESSGARAQHALAAAGDRAGAVKHARLYQDLVRQELEMEPDSEIADLAAALSRPAASPHTPSVTPSVATSAPQGKERSRRDRTVLYALIALAMLISAGAIWGWLRPAPAKQVVRSMLAIDSTEA